MATTKKRKKLTKPVEAFRKDMLQNPDVQSTAASLGIPLEDFVADIVKYAQNPDLDVELTITPDETLRELGYDAPTLEEAAFWVKEAVSNDPLIRNARSDYQEGDDKKAVELSPRVDEESSAEAPADPALLEELKKRRGSGF
jgi:hypothetical protein